MNAKIPYINLNQFKVFMAVYETRSMTEAANILHLTQSGVSQHIKALESDLKAPLFSRVGRRLVPTEISKQLYPDIEKAFEAVSNRLQQMTGREAEYRGTVRIGMPIEFGINVVVPKLSVIGTVYPKINFDITLDYASELSQKLLSGDLDFAFVDEIPLDSRIEYKAVTSENLVLCALEDYTKKKGRIQYTQSYFEGLDYIEYRRDEPILRRWMLHHIKRKNLKLNVRSHIMDVQGVAKFITNGLGAGVLPEYIANDLIKRGYKLYIYEGKGKPLCNEIRHIRLKKHEVSRAAQKIMDELVW